MEQTGFVGKAFAGKEKGRGIGNIMAGLIVPLLLFLLPLRHIGDGIDISDTGYNLACFVWFGTLDGMWVYVTYLANALGHAFTLLPMGNTMMGMNLYCSLVVSGIGLISWFFLKEKLSKVWVFAGIVLAIFLCWCPQVILYNYLSYFILTLGTVLLYQAVIKESKLLYLLAGFLLGLGVGVRFSNLTHMALIAGVWYYGFLQRESLWKLVKTTLLCVAGYLAGILAFLGMIQTQYGLEGYLDMMFGLKTMSSGGASGYSASEMLMGAFVDYIGSMQWGVLFLIYVAAGLAAFRMLKGRFWLPVRVLYVLGFLVLLRLVYGRGMFGLDYNEYFSIFWWVSLFNAFALVVLAAALLRKDIGKEEKLLYSLLLISLLILPLGSNNRSYPVINNLFLIAPAALHLGNRMLPGSFPVRAVALMCFGVLAFQSLNFGQTFIFRDGSWQEKRDTKIEKNGILKDMQTTRSNAAALEGILDYAEKESLEGKPVILYGDIPGMSYVLNMPSAITSTWSNLESYNMTFWRRDFDTVQKQLDAGESRPVVMIGKAYEPVDEKGDLLHKFLQDNRYQIDYENEKIVVYR